MRSRATSADAVTAAVFVAAGLYVLMETWSYPGSPVAGAPGPAFFPQLLAGCLIVLSLSMAASALRARKSGADDTIEWKGLRKISIVAALCIAYLALLQVWDFYLLTPPLLAAIMVIMEERRVRYLIMVPIGFVLFVYLLFHRAFGVELPSVLL